MNKDLLELYLAQNSRFVNDCIIKSDSTIIKCPQNLLQTKCLSCPLINNCKIEGR